MSLTSENRFDVGRLGSSGRLLLGFHFTTRLKPHLYMDITRRNRVENSNVTWHTYGLTAFQLNLFSPGIYRLLFTNIQQSDSL